MSDQASQIGVVIIGRNEGERLVRGLASVNGAAARVVYVDSGSTDGSVEAAKAAGAEVVLLDTTVPFTAARARNAGMAQLLEHGEVPDFVQFIDGDCELREGWLATAQAFLREHDTVAAVCGRRRERFPEASIYNRLTDQEWDTPVGEAKYCGGDVLMRLSALKAANGYNPTLIAGEEPELCVRLREMGWKIWRIEAEMTWHDAAMTRLSQWWTRCKRAGHAFAEGTLMHGRAPEHHGVPETRRALIWGLGLPLVIVLGLFITPWALLLALGWGVKVIRLWRGGFDLPRAFFLTLGNLPEAQGALGYYWSRLTRRRKTLIEYK